MLDMMLTRCRLRRTGPASNLQLWLLPPSKHTDIRRMHCLQCSSWLLVCPFFRLDLLHHWQLHL